MSAHEHQLTRREGSDSEHPRTDRLADGSLPPIVKARGTIGPYQLLCELGAGRVGTVYLARREHASGQTSVSALKAFISAAIDQSAFLARTRTWADLSHPALCELRDYGVVDGVPYVASEYLIGESLQRVLTVNGPPAERALACSLHVVAELCRGLHAAHELRDEAGSSLQLVHGELTPCNLFVLYDGSVRVSDFAIAPANTQSGRGPYLSPEQLRRKRLDRRSDVWSMGVVLWELVSGARLFSRHSAPRQAVDVLGQPIDPPSRYNRVLPHALDELVMRALERDVDARIESARTLADELDAMVAREFGPVSQARVANWMRASFPGGQDYRYGVLMQAESQQGEDGHSGTHLRTRELRAQLEAAGRNEATREESAHAEVPVPPREPEVKPIESFGPAREARPVLGRGRTLMALALLGALIVLGWWSLQAAPATRPVATPTK